jgi:uncharacterized protein YjbJ (UPF0337 family)
MLEQLGGRIKQAVGHWLGHERMHAQGGADELRGQVEAERGKIAERGEGAVKEAGEAVKRGVGEAIGTEKEAGR